MSIEIGISTSIVSVRKKISLVDFRIEKSKSLKPNRELSTGTLKVSANQSREKSDDKKKQKGDPVQNKDIVKNQEIRRHTLTKYEKRYKDLEKDYYEIIFPEENPNKSTLEILLKTNGSKSTKHSVSTLLELTQEVLQLEREVNKVLSLGSLQQNDDYNNNDINDDECEIIDFLLKLNEVKRKLIDEFNLNVSNPVATDDSQPLECRSATNDAAIEYSFLDDGCDIDIERTTTSESSSSRLDENEQIINRLTDEILMDVKKLSSDENKQSESSSTVAVLSDIPKIQPSFLRNSLLRKEKPPASLTCKQYKRFNIDFTIHELSAIYESASDVSKSERSIASLK